MSHFNILLVDDETALRKLASAMLANESNNIIEAENGVQALEILGQQEIDLVVTDLVMPDKNGIDLILAIKEKNIEVPIIAMSGGGGITGRFDYLEISELIGANAILQKPFTENELISLVNQSLDMNKQKSVK